MSQLLTRQNRLLAGKWSDAELKELKYVQSLVEAKYESAVGEDVAHSYAKREISVKVFLGLMRFSDAIERILMAHPKLIRARLNRIEQDRLVTLRNKIRNDYYSYYLRNELEGYSSEELAV